MCVMQRRSGQLIHLLYLVAYIFLTYKKPLNILHATKKKFLSIRQPPRLPVNGHYRQLFWSFIGSAIYFNA